MKTLSNDNDLFEVGVLLWPQGKLIMVEKIHFRSTRKMAGERPVSGGISLLLY
jgi:hypothetical protein